LISSEGSEDESVDLNDPDLQESNNIECIEESKEDQGSRVIKAYLPKENSNLSYDVMKHSSPMEENKGNNIFNS
jgi:hypothetical protein